MPEDLGDLYVTVNIPEFTLRIVKNGAVIHTERVITGQPTKQTPVFSEDHEDDRLPAALERARTRSRCWSCGRAWRAAAPTFGRQGLRLSRNGRDIDPESVDWSSSDIRNYRRLPAAGAEQRAGRVEVRLPQQARRLHARHATPRDCSRKSSRPFSHGCMRVRNPRRMAEILLGEDKGWDAARIADLIANGPENNEVPIDRKIGVHITYFTAWVDDKGETQIARDVYGHEQRITQALQGRWSQIAKGPNHLAPVRTPESVSYASGNFSSVGDFINSALGGF